MKISIIGASGYTGAELLRLLHSHPQAEIKYLSSETSAGEAVCSLYPHLSKIYKDNFVTMQTIKDKADESDVIFVALPHGHAMAIGKELENSKAKIIDLGADYRFSNPKTYEAWYKIAHAHQNSGAVYGLCELYADKIKNAKILANPGCYVTASILALYPLLKAGLIKSDSIIVDAASGTSGAGRALKLGSHFSEVFENFSAYGVAGHRHTPEIEEHLSLAAGREVTISFTPHLLPMVRGILATCYASLNDGVTAENIADAYGIYKENYFIRTLGVGALPATKNVRGSNFADIGWHIDKRTNRIIVLSAIDNLVKGASGQAVQNMNIMFGLDEKTGLDNVPLYP
ncbi:N-acetyl-gamma-glutamyl-phosphate reductase [Elusimicrobium posterum]|uniref:N-acetyl-gamma-glutamyl-phosphate reductase n=1 Tax=Elusimicrobium posterum TaxID=3116653 RepID=UPI003C732B5B